MVRHQVDDGIHQAGGECNPQLRDERDVVALWNLSTPHCSHGRVRGAEAQKHAVPLCPGGEKYFLTSVVHVSPRTCRGPGREVVQGPAWGGQ